MENVYENKMKLEFLSKSSNEAFARITVASFASQLDPSIEEISDIKTAVSEAVTNCIIHGYEDKVGIIKIECTLFSNSIYIEITDNGKGIEDIEKAKEPLYTTKPELERSGMGFTIMENFMDELKIESVKGVGTKVTMKKVINNYSGGNRYELETEDIIKAQNQSEEALTKIIEANTGLIWNVVKRFAGRGQPLEDLYQIGCIGMIKAIQRFDTSYNVRISTYAVPYIIRRNKKIYKR